MRNSVIMNLKVKIYIVVEFIILIRGTTDCTLIISCCSQITLLGRISVPYIAFSSSCWPKLLPRIKNYVVLLDFFSFNLNIPTVLQ